MSNTSDRWSAKIYQFPPGGRDALDGRRSGDSRLLPADQAPALVNEVLSSSCWYHEAAIQEAKPKWER